MDMLGGNTHFHLTYIIRNITIMLPFLVIYIRGKEKETHYRNVYEQILHCAPILCMK